MQPDALLDPFSKKAEPQTHFKDDYLNRQAELMDPAITEDSHEQDSSEEVELARIDYDLEFSKCLAEHDQAYDGRTNNLNNMGRIIDMLKKKG